MTETLHCPNCGLGFTLMSDYLEHMRCYVPGSPPYKPRELPSILDVLLVCGQCGVVSPIEQCEPAIDWEGHYGCPIEDCGGTMRETTIL